MEFRSIADLSKEVHAWCSDLHGQFDVVAGIPRSGMLPATIIALRLNIPLADIGSLASGSILGSGSRHGATQSHARRSVPPRARVLVIDDSVHNGLAMKAARAQLSPVADDLDLTFGAVYISPSASRFVDIYWARIAQPRVFEWNLFHHPIMSEACVDIDGVLCRDPSTLENDDGIEYEKFLRSAAPQIRPSTEIGWIVSNRLEKYRTETEVWLRNNGVRYRNLVLHDALTADERRLRGDYGGRKAEFYKASGARLFVESELRQAIEIANMAKKAVYCTETSEMITPGDRQVESASCLGRYKLRVAYRLMLLPRRSKLGLASFRARRRFR